MGEVVYYIDTGRLGRRFVTLTPKLGAGENLNVLEYNHMYIHWQAEAPLFAQDITALLVMSEYVAGMGSG
jgi:hypothetical protein